MQTSKRRWICSHERFMAFPPSGAIYQKLLCGCACSPLLSPTALRALTEALLDSQTASLPPLTFSL